ncbi:hypothetical protein Tco_0275794 [Tanacetum coccineum]
MCTYLKNMEGWKPKSLKNKSFDNIQELFDKAMKRVNTFVDYRAEMVEENLKKTKVKVMEGSSKRAGDELEQESTKKQKIDDVNETTELKRLMEVIYDEEEVAVDAIHLVTKPQPLEDLETLWRLVKAKHGYTRPEEEYERVLWGDLKVMFEPHVEDAVWRNLQENKKKYLLTPATITDMLNKKLQADHWNEINLIILKKNFKFRRGLLGIQRLLSVVTVTAALGKVNAA